MYRKWFDFDRRNDECPLEPSINKVRNWNSILTATNPMFVRMYWKDKDRLPHEEIRHNKTKTTMKELQGTLSGDEDNERTPAKWKSMVIQWLM